MILAGFQSRWKIAAAFWTVLILVLLLIPSASLPETRLLSADKFAHAFLFAVHFVLVFQAMEHRLSASLVIGVVFAVITELLQAATGDRSADALDALADVAGIAIALGLMAARGNLRRPSRVPPSEYR